MIDVLSKLAGLWVNGKNEIMYSQASQITFICPMIFNYFPLDTQVSQDIELSLLLYENMCKVFTNFEYISHSVPSGFWIQHVILKRIPILSYFLLTLEEYLVLQNSRKLFFIMSSTINHIYNPTFIAGVQVSSWFLLI